MTFKVRTNYAPWDDHMQFVVREEMLESVAYLLPGTWERHDRGAVDEKFVWRLPMDRARALMSAFAEAAWESGWRPEGHATADISAMKAHLEDMRKLVFEKQ